MRICKVWDDDYPWDVRVEKVAGSLTALGHDVHLAARNRKRLQPTVERLKECTVHRMEPWTWAPARLDRASMFPAFMNPRWVHHIRRVATAIEADLIQCRDLPLAPTCIHVGRQLGIPVVMDMAENYPAMLRSRHSTGETGPLDLVVRNPTFAHWVEQWTLEHIDAVMVVVEESGQRLESLGLPREKIAVVCNTPPLSRLQGATAEQGPAEPLRVVYLGLVEAQRGIGTMLDAMAILRGRNVPVQLVIFGDGVDGALFRRRAADLGLTPPYVEFRGRVPNPEALAALTWGHVGMIPHWADESWNTTIPNKLFDYMACGLVPVTSNCVPAERIVKATGAGVVYGDRDPQALAGAFERLLDSGLRRTYAARGREAVRSAYNWEADVARMMDLLNAAVHRR